MLEQYDLPSFQCRKEESVKKTHFRIIILIYHVCDAGQSDDTLQTIFCIEISCITINGLQRKKKQKKNSPVKYIQIY